MTHAEAVDYNTLLAEIRAEHHRLEQRLVTAWQEALEEISTMLYRPEDLCQPAEFDQLDAMFSRPDTTKTREPRITFVTDEKAPDEPSLDNLDNCFQETDKPVAATKGYTSESLTSSPVQGGPFRDLPLQAPNYAPNFEQVLDTYFPQALQKTKDLHMSSKDVLANVHLSLPRKILQSRVFGLIIALVIVLNALYAAIDCNIKLHESLSNYDLRIGGSLEQKSGTTLAGVELGFCIFFSLELLLRVAAYGPLAWIGEEWRWNLFDTVLVVLSILSLYLDVDTNLSYGRLFRLLHMGKAMRTIRVLKYFQRTRIILYSVLSSMTPLFWSFTFVLLILYLFSIWMMMASMDFIDLQGSMPEQGVRGDSQMKTIKTFFSSFFMTMLSLFMTISGGRDWWDLVEFTILGEVTLVWGLGFIFFEFVMILGVLNMITGLFVTAVDDMSQLDRETAIRSEQDKAIAKVKQLKSLFEDFDDDGSGEISWTEFEKNLHDPEIQAYFAALDINVGRASALFKLLDVDESQTISVDDFVLGCLRLKGQAKTLDIGTLMYECRSLKRMVCGEARTTRKSLNDMNSMISAQNEWIKESLGRTLTRNVPHLSRRSTRASSFGKRADSLAL